MAKTKNEIDKESMFNKIMPSNLINKNKEANQAPMAEIEPSPSQQSQISQKQSENATVKSTADLLSSGDKKNSFVKRKTTIMVNVMEELVASKLDMAFNKFNCCKCDKCRQDVAALALNKIQPKYMILDKDEVKDIVNNYDNPSIMSAIIQAMLTVMSHPRH